VLGTSGALPASVAMNLGNGVLVVAGLWLSHRTVSQ
jgi:hypothetical protein